MAIKLTSEREQFGTTDVVTTTSSSVANAAFSVDADTGTWINTDGVDLATAVLTFTPSAITTAADTIKLYASRNKVDGTNSENFPSTSFKEKLLGTFVVDASASAQTVAIEIQLDNCVAGQEYEFAIENLLTTVSINSGWTLAITPKVKTA